MSGTIGDLSPKQADVLKNFREKVKDVLRPGDDDRFLLRWLRARSFDLRKSEIMLRNHMEWRKKMNLEKLKDEFKVPEVIQKYDGGGVFGHDKDGCPVWIYTIGRLDPKGLLRAAKKSDIINDKLVTLEKIFDIFKEESEKRGKVVDQVVVIEDLDQLGMRHLWKPGIELFTEALSIYEAHYPEILKTGIVINAPRIFPIAFNLVKPFLSEETLKKIKILGKDYKEELLKHIDADQLPVYYGGTCRDPDGDPMCKSKLRYGGEVPKSYINHLSDKEMENFIETSVKQGSSIIVDVEVTEVNSALRWQFMTDGNDIKFGIYLKKKGAGKDSKPEEIIPCEKVNSHLVPEDGIITCKEIGTYLLKFDNSYSWVRSKKMKYDVEVLQPDHDNQDI